jgi:23S rRNA pseudouridine1911/1915/1917 synthase
VETREHHAEVPADMAGQRLDQVLASLFPDYSRSRLQACIREGRVTVDGRVPRLPRERMDGGERLTLAVVERRETEAAAEPIALDLRFEDEQVLVLCKPAGLVVHPGAGNPAGTLVNALLHHRPALRGLPRAGIVHRLDKDTSGLMVVAATPEAHTSLVRQLAERAVQREYEAVCAGVMTGGGRVDAPLGRHPVDRKRMAVREDGRPAVTHYRVLARFRGHTHVQCRLETGRTHQIRVHLAHVRHPLVGDPLYGGRLAIPAGASAGLAEALRGFGRQALHAARLGFAHPASGEAVRFEAEAPADFQRLLAALTTDARE